MNFLTQLKISTRLVLAFAVLLIISLISTGFSLLNARNSAEATRQMMEVPLAKERLVSDWYLLTFAALARTSMIARSSDETLATKFADEISSSTKKANDIVKQVEALLTAEDEKTLFKNITVIRAKYQTAKDLVMTVRKSGDAAAAERSYSEAFVPAARDYSQKVLELLSLQRKTIDHSALTIEQANARGAQMVMLLTVLLISIGILVAIMISRSITTPLQQAINAAGKVAAGDLTTVIDTSGKDEVAQLMHALSAMTDALRTIVSQVQQGTHAIADAASEISTGNLDLSARTEQQAGSLEETAASVEQLTATVKQNAENARQANQLSLTASEVAVKGGDVVSQVVATMGSINDSSKKIVDIIGVIDSIAFQTNILALNAAVEAARAGEQGRGFAVVAAEVRNLAQRSAAAAKEIKALIGDSVEKVSVGAKLVGQAGSTMDEVVASIKRVTVIMSEITTASQEQHAGIDQVNHAIIEMDHTTQQNAALVEQAAAAAESMMDQAAALARVVDTFKLDQQHAVTVPPRRTQARKPAASRVPVAARIEKKTGKAIAAPQLPARAAATTLAKADDWEEF